MSLVSSAHSQRPLHFVHLRHSPDTLTSSELNDLSTIVMVQVRRRNQSRHRLLARDMLTNHFASAIAAYVLHLGEVVSAQVLYVLA